MTTTIKATLSRSPEHNYAGEKTPGKFAIFGRRPRGERVTLKIFREDDGYTEWWNQDGLDLSGTPIFDSADEAESFARSQSMIGVEIHRLPIPSKAIDAVGFVGMRRYPTKTLVNDFDASLVCVVD